VRVLPPGDPGTEQAFLAESAGRFLPGWQLCLFLDASDPFAAEADRRIGNYLWIGLLAIALVAVLAMLMAGVLFRQIRLTRLKNDFVATVSHELKTPLSSMRVLVDTLLEGRVRDAEQGRQYLRLIARENERLSRLIENFLSFSRMERNKRAFQFAELAPAELVQAAAAALQERVAAAGGSLEVESAPDLPPILADRDAMVTVLLNLVDNACKYSGDDKRDRLETWLHDGEICFAVQDHGIGLSRRDARRIMDRFYQVDQRLSRKAGGCGLGLSIVKFIVDAHHGKVEIQSRLGEGSTFTVRAPVASVRSTPESIGEGEAHGG
jgi:signal transduction histidine kinase